MLVTLGTLGSEQSKGTQKTMEAAVHLPNCAATHPDAKVWFRASDMVPHIRSDASCLSKPEAKSRVGGHFFPGGKDDPDPNSEPPAINGAVHVESSIMRNAMASAAEAETGGFFVNGQAGQPIQVTLEEMGHTQPSPTPIHTDDTTADGSANETVKPKRTKAMDMRFHWIINRVHQGQHRVHWKRGAGNLADHFTKHHPPSHHMEK